MSLVLAPPRHVPVLDEEAVDSWLAGLSREAFAVEEVHVVRYHLDDSALGHLAPILLHRCVHIRRLDLSGNALTDQGCDLLAQCLVSFRELLGGNSRLRALILSSNNIGPAGAEAVALNFFPVAGGSFNAGDTSAYTLALSENPLGDEGVAAVAGAARRQQGVAVLQLSGVDCGIAGCKALIESLSWLSGLDISDNAGIPSILLTSVLSGLGQRFQHLGLSHLTSSQRGGLESGALSQALTRCHMLQTLSLSGNELQDAGLRQLVDALTAGGAHTLKELELTGNKLRDGNLLAKLLAGSPALEALSLEANELDDMALVALVAGIALSPTGKLRKLGLARNRFGNDGMVALADTVKNPRRSSDTSIPTQAQLVRWLTALGDSQAGGDFWDGCDSRLGLRQLDLAFNIHVTDEGAEAVAGAVIHESATGECTHLRLLNLYDSSIGGPGRTALEKAVRASHARVERYAGALIASLGAGETPLNTSWPPWPLCVQGLAGFEALDAEFVAKALAWRQACQRLLAPEAPPAPAAPTSAPPASSSLASPAVTSPTAQPVGVTSVTSSAEPGSASPLEAATVAQPISSASPVTLVDSAEAAAAAPAIHATPPPSPEPIAGAPAPLAAVMERARRALQQRGQAAPTSPQTVGGHIAPAPAATNVTSVTPAVAPATVAKQVAEPTPQVTEFPMSALGSVSNDGPPSGSLVSGVAGSVQPALASQAVPSIGTQEGAVNQDAPAMPALSSTNTSSVGTARAAASSVTATDARGAASRAEAVLSRARQTLRRVTVQEPPIAAAVPVAAGSADAVAEDRDATAASDALGDDRNRAATWSPSPGSVTPAAPSPSSSEATQKLDEAKVQLDQVTSEWNSRIIATDEPEAEVAWQTQDVVPERTVRLEREVAELREDVRRIENTVTSLNPEPECEAATDGYSTPPRPAINVDEAAPVSTPKAAGPPQAADSPAPGAAISPKSAPPQLSPGKGAKGAGRGAMPPPPPKRPAAPKGRGPPAAPPPKGRAPKAANPQGSLQRRNSVSIADAPFQKKLYWKQLDVAETEGTMFDATSDRKNSRPSLNIDALQGLFEGESSKTTESRRRATHTLNKVQKKAIGLKLLSDHRARNIAIVLKRLPVTTKELARILRQLEWEATELSTDDLEQLLDIIPAQDEAEKLREHRSPEARAKLRDVEQMVLPLALLSRGAARVRLLCIARSAKAQFASNCRSFKSLRAACHAIHQSDMLREVMHLALDLGNYINHGDSSKGAKAISIGSLLTLREFKAGKISSMHFLCASLYFSMPSRDAAEVLAKELRPVVNASKLQVQTLYAQVRCFERDLEVINSEERNYLHEYASNRKRSGSDPSPENGAQDEDEEDEPMEEQIAAGCVADMEAEANMPEGLEREVEDASRWVEDVVKIRGSATRRLRCMRRIVDKLCQTQAETVKATATEAHSTLRFCGVPVNANKKEIAMDLEPLLQQLADFIKVFKTHWDEVRADLPRYENFFAESAGAQKRNSSATGSTG